jgi:hypothetical protein
MGRVRAEAFPLREGMPAFMVLLPERHGAITSASYVGSG